MIVWVASYPRAGNRLCRTILRRAFGATVASAAREDTLRRDLSELLGSLGVGPQDDPLPALRELEEPVFLKTHSLPQHVHRIPAKSDGGPQPPAQDVIPPDAEESRALYLVRDGRDSLLSFAHYVKEVAKRARYRDMGFEEIVADLMRRPYPYGGWSGNVGAWRRRSAPTVLIRFEDLIQDPVARVAAAAGGLGIDLPEPQGPAPTIDEMRAGAKRREKPELVRGGRTGSWRSDFPASLLDEFWERHGREMEALGYPRA